MGNQIKTNISISATIHAPVAKVWQNWTDTQAITQWNSASPEWHTTKATHELKPGGRFTYRMEAKDGSFGFDFSGIFDTVKPNEYLETTLDDGRQVKTTFTVQGDKTQLTQIFEAEQTHSIVQQQEGWQNILNNFKNYVENLND